MTFLRRISQFLFPSAPPPPAALPGSVLPAASPAPASASDQRLERALGRLRSSDAQSYARDGAMQDADALLQEGETGAARALLTAALGEHPSNPLRERLARVLMLRGEQDVAERLLKVLAADPEYAHHAEMQLGQLAEDAGRTADARRHYERALAITPDNQVAREKARRLRAREESVAGLSSGAFDALSRLWGEAAAAGRYVVQSEVGRGGAATLFHALEISTGRAVALKVFHPRGDPELRAERIRREASLAARFNVPSIVPVLDVFPERDVMVMPYYPGGSLKGLLGKGPLPAAQALRLVADVADALALVHAHGVAHLDVKPSNVLMDGMQPVLTDFGAAGAQEMGQAAGTPPYMAPEILQLSRADARSDLYALGVVMVECLTGTPGTQLPAFVDSGNAHERGAALLCHKLTQENPDDRLQSARAVADACLLLAELAERG